MERRISVYSAQPLYPVTDPYQYTIPGTQVIATPLQAAYGGEPWDTLAKIATVVLPFVGGGAAATVVGTLAGNGNGAGNGGQAAAAMPYGIAGPGVPEPADGTWSKRWDIACNSKRLNATWRIYFWQMLDGYTLMYNPMSKGWKRWKPKRNIVLSSDPRLSNIRRGERAIYGKLRKLAKVSSFLALQKRPASRK